MRAPTRTLCLLLGPLLVLGGCAKTAGTHLGGGKGCVQDHDCVAYGDTGPCLPSPLSARHYCTSSEPGCKSGLRWSQTAGDELAGICVLSTRTDGGVPADLGDEDLASFDGAASDGGADLAAADLAIPDLSTTADLARADLSGAPRDLATAPDLSMSTSKDLATAPDLATPPPDLATVDLTPPPDLAPTPDLAHCALAGCTTGNESRDGCANARTIGRKDAAATWKISSTTCGAYDRFKTSGKCWNASEDHAYRLFMRAGETVVTSGSTSWGCVNSSWGATIMIYDGGGCGTQVCPSAPATCSANNGWSPKVTFVAPHDGWYVIVMGGSTAFDDDGDYSLSVKLTCLVAGCECP